MSGGPVLGLRRAADLGPWPDPGDEPALVEVIRAEIRAAGPMTFARFMDLALYHPEFGYYATGLRGPGRPADFLTAPESHPVFGWAVARQLEEAWDRLERPERFTVREFGAGTGALAAGIVEGLDRGGSPLRAAIRYRVAERSENRLRQVAGRLSALGAADVLEPDAGAPIDGAILANEVLDALPVHRVEGGADGEIAELFVGLDGDGMLATVAGPASTLGLRARLDAEGVRLAPGQRVEICLEVDGWIEAAAAGLRRGLVLLVDYGHPAPALYEPSRGSLLRAYVHHRVHDDPYANVGRQDLTAHVDLTAVARAAAATGLVHLGTTTQAAFLAGLGAGELLAGLQEDPATTLGTYLEARSALFRMLDPRVTGGFAVMAFGRDMAAEPPLAGLAYHLPGRR
ncbi:MAG TPA: SAM-dependent methyltransferase [Candidatus Sulfomarinibacteraceae bacterium]|nr:SAM-dependent methyltransferase [Candidatus Sulfomarinibacteraceae bacterium]